MPEIEHDFPFGAPRFIQRMPDATPPCATAVILRDDELTGECGGRVLRS